MCIRDSRRPPLDPINALLSFLYSMLGHDARAACEATGLDPQVGFLHRDRPGRAGLALDLMEEFRPFLADRLALSLINRRQVAPSGFTTAENGAVLMDDSTRKTVLVAYQRRKQEEIVHPFLGEKVSIGLLIHLQARLLARHLRNDLDAYPVSYTHLDQLTGQASRCPFAESSSVMTRWLYSGPQKLSRKCKA